MSRTIGRPNTCARAALACLAITTAACTSRDRPDAGSGELAPFSFFVASYRALQALSGSEAGFGGDLRYGETGPGAGLRGADKICAEISERSMPGAAAKRWRAFLSAAKGEDGAPVNAIDRIGEGPWYDRLSRVVAQSKPDLLHDRPEGADSAIAHDLPNEEGVPNQKPDSDQPSVDNHDILTGTNDRGELHGPTATCLDWTSALGDPSSEGRPRVGHSWDRMADDQVIEPPELRDGDVVELVDGGVLIMRGMRGPTDGAVGIMRGPQEDGGPSLETHDGGPPGGDQPGLHREGEGDSSGANWMSALDEAGCAPGVNLVQDGPPHLEEPTVGSGGGYGGIYCFALAP